MRRTPFISTGLAAVIALAITPAGAGAATAQLTDDSLADFAAGSGTNTNTWVVEPGTVALTRSTIDENFDSLDPSRWTTEAGPPWTGGTATAAGGVLTVDGARVNTADPPLLQTTTATQVLEFRATFGAEIFEHVGFADSFNGGPWAIFSTGSATPGLYARTLTASEGTATNDAISGFNPLVPHGYRIEWSTEDVKYYVDGALVATHNPPVTLAMRPGVSDLTKEDSSNIKVDWLALGTLNASGTYVSRVHDAGDSHAVWDTLTAIGGASIQTRSGNTPTPDGSWSAFQSLGGGGAIQSPPGRYIQYQATLDAATRTTLDRVAIGYDIDSVAPDAAITGVQVSGTTATVSFGSAAGDLARFECSLDHGAYAACSSPKQFTGLAAGSHVVSVRAIDRAGNVGPAAESAFRVDSPSGGSARADRTAPKVTLTLLSSRASKSGAVTLRLGCPATESRCKVKVALKLGHKTVASTTTSIAGGKTKKVTLRLSKSARRQLARRKSLKVKAVISATDAAGNRSTRTVGLALRAQRH